MHALCWISSDLLNSSVRVIGTSISDSPVSASPERKTEFSNTAHAQNTLGRKFTQPQGLVLVLEPTQSTHEVLQLCHRLRLVPELAVHIMP